MDSLLKIALVAITVIVVLSLAVSSAYASSWGGNPFNDSLYTGSQGNISFHPDYIKDTSPKSYGWSTSKVCGLELCAGEKLIEPSRSHLQNQHLSSSGGLEFASASDYIGFNGFFIKGNFPSPFVNLR